MDFLKKLSSVASLIENKLDFICFFGGGAYN